MRSDPLAADDLIAERRFAYGKAAADEADFGAAADMFEQALERAPDWAAAWFALGEAREKLGKTGAAAEAFRAALRADPEDAQGAAARLALIGRGDAPSALPQAYVARLFDDYAPRFDAHVTESLSYRAPALLAHALSVAAPDRRFAAALDLGCGTGLMGQAVRDRVEHLTGVDLSPAMVGKASRRGVYDRLVAGDAVTLLRREPQATYDLIVAADSLVYFGDLAPPFAAARAALAPGGLFALSLESLDGEGFKLHPAMRFVHSRAYVERTAEAAGLIPLSVTAASPRQEAGSDVAGLICVFRREQTP